MAIETLDEWNAVLGYCGCCAMPSVTAPLQVCESLSSTFLFHGYKETKPAVGDAAPVTTRYKNQGSTETIDKSGSTEFKAGETLITKTTRTAKGSHFIGYGYNLTYQGNIGSGQGCPEYLPPLAVFTCLASGSASWKFENLQNWGTTEDPGSAFSTARQVTATISSAEGDQTEEHKAWELVYGDAEGYDAALATYETDHAQYLEDYETYETAYQAWIDGGEIGDPPSEPTDATEPTPEPEEFYGPCDFKVVTTTQWFAHAFGYNTDGSSADDAPPGAFQEWLDEGAVGDPPASGTRTVVTNTQSPLSMIAAYAEAGDSGTYSNVNGFNGPVDYEAWLSEVSALVSANSNFPKDDCVGNFCNASYFISDSNDPNQWILESDIFRFRWQLDPRIVYKNTPTGQEIDSFWPGTYFKVVWQVLTEPPAYAAWHELKLIYDAAVAAHDAWEADTTIPMPEEPEIPDNPGEAPTPAATLSEDQIWEWTGPLNPEEVATYQSPWYVVSAPIIKATKRIVNIRYYGYNSPYGSVPQITGEGYEIL